jgi:chromosome segregation ATPase
LINHISTIKLKKNQDNSNNKDAEIIRLRKLLENLDMEKDGTMRDNNRLKDEYHAMELKLVDKEKNIETMKSALEEDSRKISTLNQMLNEKDRETANLKKQIERLNQGTLIALIRTVFFARPET